LYETVIYSVFLFFSTLAMAQTKQIRTVGDFSGISSASGIMVEITQGEENKVVVSASKDALVENLKTEVDKDGLLKIYYKNKENNWSGNKNLKLNAYVTFKNINKLSASSGSSLAATNTVNADVLSINVSSGASFTAAIKSVDCSVNISSGSSSKVSGTATNVKIDASSGSTFKAADLSTETCKASASSGAEIKIGVSKKLSASASSGGSIKYKGNPDVEKKSLSSGGEVKAM
jgi:Putative auto-transporter adhesin, head GIN domain